MSGGLLGILALGTAVLIGAYLVLGPRPVRLPMERRRPGTPRVRGLEGVTTAAVDLVARLLRRRGGVGLAEALDRAGLRTRPQEFAFLVVVGSLVTGALGLLLGGPLLGIVLAALAPLGARGWLRMRACRRRKAFAEQLDDTLQLLASNLRAGHSLLQALAAVSREAEAPTAEELTRVINQTRVGRDLAEALDATAARMGSEDFAWVTQAIAIQREVGGNLAEVLDGVSHTIRQRGEIRRHVAALSAEGRLSGVILMLLPVGVGGFLLMTNPGYLAPLTGSVAGYAMLAVGAVLLVVGGIWLRKTVEITF